MKEHLIIELSNGEKYIAIDMLEYKKEKYLLLSELSNSEKNMSNNLCIVIYDDVNNNLDKIEDPEIFNFIKKMFDKRLVYKRIELNVLEHINVDKLVEVVIENIDNYEYKLYYQGKTLYRNINFLSRTKPRVQDKLYLSKDTLEEDMLTFGKIKNTDYINNSNILIIKRGSQKVYLERYYG